MQADLSDILGGATVAMLALAIAAALVRLGAAGFAFAAPEDAEAVPLVRVLALGTGALGGVALVVAGAPPGAFLPGGLFDADGPWAVGIAQVLSRHALPSAATLVALRDAMLAPAGLAGLAGWLAIGGVLLGAATARRLWYGQDRIRAFGAFLLLALHTALLVHYTTHLLAWFAAQLGFWLFALALLVFQRWRYRSHAVH